MGSPWRNREFWRYFLLLALAGGLPAAGCFLLHPAAGGAALLLLAVLLGGFWRFSLLRYRRLGELSARLARIGAGDYSADVAGCAEGELSILASEIGKLTSALAQQAEILQRDKAYLADSLADISHQLKTPLTSLSMLTDLLEQPELPAHKRAEFLGGMRASLDRIQWLIAALLKLSRLDAGAADFHREPVALREVVEQAAAPLLLLLELREQTLDLRCGDVTVTADRGWLAEAVGNLIKNAAEHAGQGGVVAVCCGQNPLYTQIQIMDSGPGIPPEDLPRVFERFYRGKNAAPDSVGIGLALCHSIVRNLGGSLTAENRPEGGALFTIRLYGQSAAKP